MKVVINICELPNIELGLVLEEAATKNTLFSVFYVMLALTIHL